MDDSITEEVKKPQVKTSVKKSEDSLVAKLKEEMGIEEKTHPEKDSPVIPSASEESQDLNAESDKKEKEIATSPRSVDMNVAPRNDKGKKPGKAKPRSKKYLEASKDLDRSKFYPLSEALDIVKKMSYAKFNGTLEAHINTHTLGIRGLVSLPFASGKKLRILAFPSSTLGKNDKGEFEKMGVVLGDDSTINEINKGKIDFDILITTPEWMPRLAKVAKILGSKGLMPNPKNGTITEDIIKAIAGFQGGKTEYKTEAKANVIHIGLGKLNQPNEELEANIKTLYQILGKSKISRITLSPTMGPGVKLNLSSI